MVGEIGRVAEPEAVHHPRAVREPERQDRSTDRREYGDTLYRPHPKVLRALLDAIGALHATYA